MKKRFFAAILVAATLLQLVALSGCRKTTDSDTPAQQGMTRGEWITLLGQTMGMEDFQTDAPYYQDLTSGSTAYPYVQSCREWGVLNDSAGQFRPDDIATPEFISTTAALATGLVPDEILDNRDAIVDFAKELGLAPPDGDSVSAASALTVAESTQDIYMNDRHDDVVNIVWADGIIDLTSSSQVTMNDAQVTMPADQAADLMAGSIFIAPGSASDPSGIALKVTGITVVDGIAILQTEEPDLGDLFDEITIYERSEPDPSSMVLADGVTLGPVANNLTSTSDNSFYLDDLVNHGNNDTSTYETKGFSTTFTVNFTKGKVSVAPEWDDIKVTADRLLPSFPVDNVIGASAQDDLGSIFEKSNYVASIPITKDGVVQIDENGWERHLELKNKFEGSYEITGTISVNNLYVDTGFEFKKILGIPTGIKKASFEVNADLSANLTLKGELSEELSLGTVPINVGGVGTVELEFILYLDASGELQVKAELKNNVKFEYNNGNYKKTKQTDQSVSAEAVLEAEAGPKIKVTFKILGIRIIDVQLSIGVNFSVEASEKISCAVNDILTDAGAMEAKIWTGSVALESKIRLPIIKLKVGVSPQTLANKLNIKGDWTLISKNDAPLQFEPEFLNREFVLWTYSEAEYVPAEDADTAAGFTMESFVLILNGDSQTINLEATDGKLPKIIWTSEDPTIATVDTNGTVTPVSAGVTVVKATNQDNENEVVKCTIIVQEIDESNWEFLPADMEISIA